MDKKKYYGGGNRERMGLAEARKKGGYPYLVLRLFKNWIRNIRQPKRTITNSKSEIEWLKEQREVAKNGATVWFAAWEFYFGYSAENKREKLVKLIDSEIEGRCG